MITEGRVLRWLIHDGVWILGVKEHYVTMAAYHHFLAPSNTLAMASKSDFQSRGSHKLAVVIFDQQP